MAKTRYKMDYIVRNEGDDTSDLLAIHQTVFKGNLLALWTANNKVIIKVANTGQVRGKSLKVCKDEIGFVEPVKHNG